VTPGSRASLIREKLERELDAVHVAVEDLSHRHTGHEGARSGAGHFEVVVVSPRFEGLGRVAAQRLVYAALAELMGPEIHALSMRAMTPGQWQETL
jgi:BolA protein